MFLLVIFSCCVVSDIFYDRQLRGAVCISTGEEAHSSRAGYVPTGKEVHSSRAVCIPTGKETHSSRAVCIPTGKEPHSSRTVCIPTGKEVYSSRVVSIPTGEEAHSSRAEYVPTGKEAHQSNERKDGELLVMNVLHTEKHDHLFQRTMTKNIVLPDITPGMASWSMPPDNDRKIKNKRN